MHLSILTFHPLLKGNADIYVVLIVILLAVIAGLCIYIFRMHGRPEAEKMVNVIAEQLFDSWPVGIIITNPKGYIDRINKQAAEDLQQNMGCMLNRHLASILEIIQDQENVLPRFLQNIQEDRERVISFSSNSFICELKRKVRFLIEGSIVGIYDGGKLSRIVLYYRNVLEERTSTRLLNIALNRMQIFQWSYDMDRDLMVIEPRYFEYLGIPTKDYTLTTEEFKNYLHPDDVDTVIGALASQLEGNLNENLIPYRLRRRDGTYEWFEVQSTYVGQLANLPFRVIGICMSTQKYKDTEARLNEALQKAQRSDQLKSMFLANMSHEIRTPLNAIVGFSTLLAAEDAELSREEINEFSSLIEKNSQLLMVLISDILDLSKIESNTMDYHFQDVSLHTMLDDIGKAQKLNMPAGVEMVVDLPAEDLRLHTDSARLGQVLNNMINNAVKFTCEGSISLGYRQKNPETVELYVRDTGAGMSEEVLDHIFERFYKGDAFVQGTGLGLPICKNIIEHLGGNITVASRKNEGTRFTIVLPLQAAT